MHWKWDIWRWFSIVFLVCSSICSNCSSTLQSPWGDTFLSDFMPHFQIVFLPFPCGMLTFRVFCSLCSSGHINILGYHCIMGNQIFIAAWKWTLNGQVCDKIYLYRLFVGNFKGLNIRYDVQALCLRNCRGCLAMFYVQVMVEMSNHVKVAMTWGFGVLWHLPFDLYLFKNFN